MEVLEMQDRREEGKERDNTWRDFEGYICAY